MKMIGFLWCMIGSSGERFSFFGGEIFFVISLTVVGGGRQEFQKPGFL